jgi:hypothetical protein
VGPPVDARESTVTAPIAIFGRSTWSAHVDHGTCRARVTPRHLPWPSKNSGLSSFAVRWALAQPHFDVDTNPITSTPAAQPASVHQPAWLAAAK